jgi:hypothetical protein
LAFFYKHTNPLDFKMRTVGMTAFAGVASKVGAGLLIGWLQATRSEKNRAAF